MSERSISSKPLRYGRPARSAAEQNRGGFLPQFEKLCGVTVQSLARRSHLKAFAPYEQARSDLLFEFRDGHAHGGLCTENAAGCPLDVPLFSKGDEHLQLLELHSHY